jgi:hypothetical protein
VPQRLAPVGSILPRLFDPAALAKSHCCSGDPAKFHAMCEVDHTRVPFDANEAAPVTRDLAGRPTVARDNEGYARVATAADDAVQGRFKPRVRSSPSMGAWVQLRRRRRWW